MLAPGHVGGARHEIALDAEAHVVHPLLPQLNEHVLAAPGEDQERHQQLIRRAAQSTLTSSLVVCSSSTVIKLRYLSNIRRVRRVSSVTKRAAGRPAGVRADFPRRMLGRSCRPGRRVSIWDALVRRAPPCRMCRSYPAPTPTITSIACSWPKLQFSPLTPERASSTCLASVRVCRTRPRDAARPPPTSAAARPQRRDSATLGGSQPLRRDHVMRGVAAGRSAQRACERSSDWRRGAASSPDPDSSHKDGLYLPVCGAGGCKAPPTRNSTSLRFTSRV